MKATGKASLTQSVPKFALRAIGAPPICDGNHRLNGARNNKLARGTSACDVWTEVPEQAQVLHNGCDLRYQKEIRVNTSQL
jgi:hypothetical protein